MERSSTDSPCFFKYCKKRQGDTSAIGSSHEHGTTTNTHAKHAIHDLELQKQHSRPSASERGVSLTLSATLPEKSLEPNSASKLVDMKRAGTARNMVLRAQLRMVESIVRGGNGGCEPAGRRSESS